MQINESGTNDFPGDIHPLAIRSGMGGGLRAKGGNPAVPEKNIGGGIEAVGGIDDAAAGEKQGSHSARRA